VLTQGFAGSNMILFFLKRKIKPIGVLGRYPAVTLTLVPSSKPKKHFTPLKKKLFLQTPQSVASLWRADPTQTGEKKKKPCSR
jgi:hypothetical protein